MRKDLLWILAAVVLLSACHGDDTPQPPVPAADITVTDTVDPISDLEVLFGTVTEGNTFDQTVTVMNSGTADLVIGAVASANPLESPFSIDPSGCSGKTLSPAGSCTMTVSFASPGGISVYFEDSFDIPSNDPDVPTVTISVNGTGTSAPAPLIVVTDSASPEYDHQVPFGDITQDYTADRTVTVANLGTADLILGDVANADSLEVPFSINPDNCSGKILTQAASCTLTVRFAPAVAGPYTGSFDIPSNDPDTPTVTISVSGTAVAGSTLPLSLPATGQTTAYASGDDGSLQAGVSWPAPRFSVTYCDATGPCANQSSDCDSNELNDVVMDSLTGLEWARNGNLPAATKTWQEALTYANDSTLCGSTDWRLPNRKELGSLINFGLTNIHTWLNGQGFSGVLCEKYWTSTTYAWGANEDNAWVGSLCDGTTAMNPKTGTPWYVLPVRGAAAAPPSAVSETGQRKCYDAAGLEAACGNTGQDGDLLQGVSWPSPRFSDNGDGTVTDDLTGLTWTKDANAPGPAGCTPGAAKTWQGALDYVACLNRNSYLGGGWRLPNANELESLFHAGFDEEICNASACTSNADWLMTQGPTSVQIYYWSSTTYGGDPTLAWVLRMHEGFVQFDAKTADYYYIWPVR